MFIWWFKFIFLLLAISFFSSFLFKLYQKRKWQRQTQTIKGVIIDLVKVYSHMVNGGEVYMYLPIVEFHLSGSKEDIVRFQSKTYRYKDTFKVGDSVKVRYDKNNVQRAEIDDFSANWGTTVFLCSMGFISIFFIVLGYLMEIGYM